MTDHDLTDHDLTDEAHRATCAECAATWAELDAISAEARSLPTLTPSRDLWAGIEARIEAGATHASPEPMPAPLAAAHLTPALAKARGRWFTTPAVRYAAAAGLLMMVTATVTWRVATSEAERDAAQAAAIAAGALAPAPSDSEAAAAAALTGAGALRTASYEADFSAMDSEIDLLQTLLETRRSQLEPKTIEVLEKSMTLIDQAIAESRAALAKDPASQFLAAQLARSYSTKLTLLRSTATMPVGT